ncbi:SDR family NAD(P)-dependent oxidoreductase [Solwaraspora sp. WMMB335]|uniref:SDR family NAD(P)-dependent oxidoreductase n=1 Tax=Solwaraspora sp. WMMB335 TaxID=3404118 RepID=UPI003B948062
MSSAHPSAATLQRALTAVRDLRAKLEVTERARTEPIAIVGLSCRLPGGANSPEAFWALLRDGVDAITEVPADRWDADTLYDPDPTVPGRISSRWGGFLDQVDRFDAAFFGISPREADQMDPQQRIMLEVAWEALEHAGQTTDRLAGSQTGVFVGVHSHSNDYTWLQYADPDQIDTYTGTGTSHSVLAGRISYLLDLRGPSVALDTACSSSLVAVHLACQSLRSGECHIALAGGVNLALAPHFTMATTKMRMMATDGRCKTFDAAADGFVRGEGCGAIVLKRLSDARRDGDPVLAVIRGSAVNQDGRTNGLTAPSGLSQQLIVAQALRNAGVDPADVDAVEAHGTGTALGDPIEVEALAEVFGPATDTSRPIALGSVKTNIGHLEAAAGIAGLIKVVLALRHQAIPAHLHFHTLNPNTSLTGTRFVIPTEPRPWPASDHPRYATVSSFGWSGTNGCLVVGDAPAPDSPTSAAPTDASSPAAPTDGLADRVELLPLSARSPQALRDLAGGYRSLLATDVGQALRDLVWTAGVRRSHHPFRAVVTGRTPAELADKLAALVDLPIDGTVPDPPAGPLFVFSGQGSQWAGMGRDLLDQEPVFAETMRHCDELLRAHTDWSLLAEIRADETRSRLDRTEIAQPALVAVQASLAALWRSWGIEPEAVIGHSVGEIAAAHVAGVLTLADALRVAYHRGRVMQQAHGLGRMASVALPVAEAEAVVAGYAERLTVAAVNGPTATVLAGDPDALAEVLAALTARGVVSRVLRVEYAFHSPQMAPFQAPLVTALRGLAPQPASVPIVSTVTGRAAGDGDFDAAYWGRNIREPVRFADALAHLGVETTLRTVVEVAPQPVLARPIVEQFESTGQRAVVLASMRANADPRTTLLTTLGGLYRAGHPVDFGRLHPTAGRCVELPAYPWQRRRHWLRRAARPAVARPAGGHPLLGRRARTALPTFDSVLDATVGALGDHRVHDAVLLPLTGYLELALAAHGDPGPAQVTNLVLHEPLVLPADAPVAVQTVLTPAGGGRSSVGVFSQPATAVDDQPWTRHAEGVVARYAPPPGPPVDVAALRNRLTPAEVTPFYQRLRDVGIGYGPVFTGVRDLWRGTDEALGRVALPADVAATAGAYRWHPALLDAALQVFLAALPDDLAAAWLPIGLDRFAAAAPAGAQVWSHATVRRRDDDTTVADLDLYAPDGTPLARVEGLLLRRAGRDALRRNVDLGYEIAWESARAPRPADWDGGGAWLFLADRDGSAEALGDLLRARGDEVVVLPADPADDLAARLHGQLTADRPWRGVVHLAGLDTPAFLGPAEAEPTTGDVLTAHERTVRVLLDLARALTSADGPTPPVWLLTRGARAVTPDDAPVAVTQSPVWGLARAVGRERPDLRWTCLDLDPADPRPVPPELPDLLRAADAEDQLALRAGTVHVPRLVPATPPAEAGPVRLGIRARGVLENLTFDPAARRPPAPHEVEIRVHATGLNFRDVLNALGEYPGEAGPLGLECAGVVVAAGADVPDLAVGDRVLALAPASFASFVTVAADRVAPLPATLGHAEAATIPVAFCTAAYGLHHLAALKPGDRVLIHAAAGGVGLAAMQLVQAAGAEVFATASPAKWPILTDLGVQHVFNSRTLDFADQIRERTDGAGVDVVLNSLADDFIPYSLDLLRPGGRFLEIGKRGIWAVERVAAHRPDVAYHPYDLGTVADDDPALVRTLLRDLTAALGEGRLNPLPLRAFVRDRAVDAFRHMAQARHVGKVVVNHEPPPAVHPDATYLVTGGLGGIGPAIARWLVARGARHLVLVGRSAPTPQVAAALRDLHPDARVHVRQADVADPDALTDLLAGIAADLPALRGVVHAAGVLDDGVLDQQNWPRFARVLAPKVAGGWNLHRLTRHLPLDFLVLCSSVASLLGSAGQSGYVTANAFLDTLAQHRRARGLPATSVNWGPWADGGMAARLSDQQRQRLAGQGFRPLTADDATAALGRLLDAHAVQAGVFAVDWPAHLRQYGGAAPPLLTRLGVIPAAAPTGAAPTPATGGPRERITAAHPTERRQLLQEYVRDTAVTILGLPTSQPVNPQQPLRDLGLDSLMAVELRNALGGLAGRALPSTLVFDHPTVARLTDHLLAELFPEPARPSPTPAPPPPATPGPAPEAPADLVARVAALDDADVEALLAAKLSALEMRNTNE